MSAVVDARRHDLVAANLEDLGDGHRFLSRRVAKVFEEHAIFAGGESDERVTQIGDPAVGIIPPRLQGGSTAELPTGAGMQCTDLRRGVRGVFGVQRDQAIDIVRVEGVEPRAADALVLR